MIDNGVARARPDQPWISAKENKGARGGFGIGREVWCRMLDRSQALSIRTGMAHFILHQQPLGCIEYAPG